jgi:hypothetical protein
MGASTEVLVGGAHRARIDGTIGFDHFAADRGPVGGDRADLTTSQHGRGCRRDRATSGSMPSNSKASAT